jgi:hypothetical protein
LYDQWVIPLTKNVEVEYLLNRLDWTQPLSRACLFGLSVAGCAGKAAVQRKLLSRKSCCSEIHRLVIWLAV